MYKKKSWQLKKELKKKFVQKNYIRQQQKRLFNSIRFTFIPNFWIKDFLAKKRKHYIKYKYAVKKKNIFKIEI